MFAQGDLTTAETLYISVLRIDRKHKNARKYLGALYYRQPNLEKAAEQLAQVATLDPGDAENWHYLGNVYERMFDTRGDRKMLDQAVSCYQKAAELDAANQVVQSELARAQSKLSSSTATTP
jgi:tetratricopeptide (TPR) repeat protein